MVPVNCYEMSLTGRNEANTVPSTSETIMNENGVTIKNKLKCPETVATLSVFPINLSLDGFEINFAPDIPQMYESNKKTMTPNFLPVKKDGLHVKDD
ncbi:hypothetical protein TNIN_268111 [Trichonephila inaurata madagascariensis]|uniref:Uncharacterized protein n=1 Tax=Trichonephila inaurata madagascariensis TaxID=2747483 RepID=A0A8X6XQI2_9ARAC|nr:hypothetical protein TNIN_268111 [Trichonephila inaurata madagascariensis]